MKIISLLFMISYAVAIVKYQDLIKDLQFTVVCITNCEKFYPDLPINFQPLCNGQICPKYFEINWELDRISGEFSPGQDIIKFNNNIIRIQENVFEPKSTIRVTFKIAIESKLVIGKIVEKVITFHPTASFIDIQCISNCPYGQIYYKTILKIKCRFKCEPTIYWRLVPPPDWSKVSYGNDTLILNELSYNAHENISIYAIFLKTVGIYNLQLADSLAKLTINCLVNCKNVNFERKIYLKAHCSGNCSDLEPFVWMLTPAGTNFHSYGSKNKFLMIPAKANHLRPILEASVKQRKALTATIKLRSLCVISPPDGISLATRFQIECQYSTNLPILIFQHANLSILSFGNLLYDGSSFELNSTTFLLSPGMPTFVSIIVVDSGVIHTMKVNCKPAPFIGSHESIINYYIVHALPYWVAKRKWKALIEDSTVLISHVQEKPTRFVKHFLLHFLDTIILNIDNFKPPQLISVALQICNMRFLKKPFISFLLSELCHKVLSNITKICNSTSKRFDLFSYRVVIALSCLAEKYQFDKIINSYYETLSEGYPIYEDMFYQHAHDFFHIRRATTNAMFSLQILGGLECGYGTFYRYFKVDNGIITFTKVAKLEDSPLRVDGIKSELIYSKTLKNEIAAYEDISIHVALLQPNPFWWHSVGKSLNSEILMVNLFEGDKKLERLSSYMDIFINMPQGNPTETFAFGYLRTSDARHIFKVDVSDMTTFDIFFEHKDKDYYAYISERIPSIEEIIIKGTRIRYTKGVPMDTLLNRNKTFYIAVAPVLMLRPSYLVRVVAKKCLSWSENRGLWSTKSCYVGTLSNDTVTHCRCNHLSVFGVSAFKPKYRLVQYSKASLPKKLARSSIVIIAVFILCCTWAVCMAFAHRSDVFLENKYSVIKKLKDNNPGEHHLYIIRIDTGRYSGSRTSARVVIQLLGKLQRSNRHMINFRREILPGSKEWVALYTSKKLGKIRMIRLFHDSYGSYPHWYCEKVTVYFPESNLMFVFCVRSWFSLVYGGGATDRIIQRTTLRRMRNNPCSFSLKIIEEFRDKHIWYSIFAHPDESTFTSKERVTVAFTVLLVTLLTNAIFFDLYNNNIFRHGTLKIALNEIIIVLESLLVTVPTSFFLVVLFKYSLPWKK